MIVVKTDPVLSLFECYKNLFFSGIFPGGKFPSAGVVKIGVNRFLLVGLDGDISVISGGIEDTQYIPSGLRHPYVIKHKLGISSEMNSGRDTVVCGDNFPAAFQTALLHVIVDGREGIVVNELQLPDGGSLPGNTRISLFWRADIIWSRWK